MSMLVTDETRARLVDGTFTLAGHDPGSTALVDSKADAKDDLETMRNEIFDLHEKLMAESRRSVLLVLQGTDASGKNGTIKHVVSAVNPAGLTISSFTAPTEEELEHHFLRRIRDGVPEPGFLGVFNRSHYEDLLVPLATGSEEPAEIDKRIKEILDFELELIESGVSIVKCLLHISYDEQRERFLRRLRRPDKRWKFAESDLETRRLWDEYQLAYGEMVAATSTDAAPWQIIPADHKWYRNWIVARLLIEVMSEMDLEYPQPELDYETLSRALEAPA